MIVTLVTDFGQGKYVGAMKGAILSIDPTANIVDVSHSIAPGNLTQGAFVLYSIVPYFPQAVHLAVVDPGVGTERRGIAVKCKDAILVGPDNGVLIPAAKRLGIDSVRELTNKDFFRDEVSPTFHGRDLFGPVAAHISRGAPFSSVGPEVHDWVDLDFGTYKATSKGFEGKVIFIDRFGNLITNIPGKVVVDAVDFGGKADVKLRNKLLRVELVKSYGYGEAGKPLLTVSSSGFLELSLREGNAQKKYGVKEGASLSIKLLPARKGISK